MNKRPHARGQCGEAPSPVQTPDTSPAASEASVPNPAATLSLAGDVRIDAEFRELVVPLPADERAELERSLLAEGCREPLLVWAGRGIPVNEQHRPRAKTAQ